MLKGITKSGFEYEITDEVLDDWELFEVFAKIDRGNMTYIIEAAKMLLKYEQLNRLKEHVKQQHGKVLASAMIEEIAEIIQTNDDTKNSLSSPTL